MNDDKPEIGLADEQDLVPTEEEARDAAELASSVDRLLAGEPGESNDLMMAAVMIRSSMRWSAGIAPWPATDRVSST